MLKPIDLGNGKFGIKKYDENGGSMGIMGGEFATEAEAQAAIDNMPSDTEDEVKESDSEETAEVESEEETEAAAE